MRIRKLFGLNQQRLAAYMDLHPSTVSRWLNGANDNDIGTREFEGFKRFREDLIKEAAVNVTAMSDEERERYVAEGVGRNLEHSVRTQTPKRARTRRNVKGKKVATG